MFKKIALLALVLVLSLSLFVGCGKNDDSSSQPIQPDTSVSAPEDTQLTGSLEDIMSQIYAGVKSELPVVANTEITAENSQYFTGLANLDNVEEALASEAMIGSIAHSVVLVRVKEGVDVETVKADIKAGIDPRKWICVGVEPEDVIVENIGNTVLLVLDDMAPQEFLDSFNALK